VFVNVIVVGVVAIAVSVEEIVVGNSVEVNNVVEVCRFAVVV
jgi:hypothetical protein